MIGLAAITVGVLFAAAVYLLTSRNTQRVALGFMLLSNAANLLVVTSAGLPRQAAAPFVPIRTGQAVDPLPHAFVLTAIVIGLGALALLLAMVVRAHDERRTDELEDEEQG